MTLDINPLIAAGVGASAPVGRDRIPSQMHRRPFASSGPSGSMDGPEPSA